MNDCFNQSRSVVCSFFIEEVCLEAAAFLKGLRRRIQLTVFDKATVFFKKSPKPALLPPGWDILITLPLSPTST